MQISPRYDGPPILELSGDPAAIVAPLVRQRARLESILGSLSDDEWRTPSRCDGWTVQDVIAHLVGTNRFWTASIGAGAAGEPTRILEGFDPKATPAAMVDAVRGVSPAETHAEYVESNRALADLAHGLDASVWSALGEAPPGHIALSAVAHHALWDCWIHERDVLLPLGRTQERADDEFVACLRYCAAIGPALALRADRTRTGALVLEATDPSVRVVVTVGGDAVRVDDGPVGDDALVLSGDAVELVDALSIRAPLGQSVPATHGWLLSGLSDVFETSFA